MPPKTYCFTFAFLIQSNVSLLTFSVLVNNIGALFFAAKYPPTKASIYLKPFATTTASETLKYSSHILIEVSSLFFPAILPTFAT